MVDENLSNEELEEKGFGRCDKCKKVDPIGRGENFEWDEETSQWLCNDCAAKRGVEHGEKKGVASTHLTKILIP